MKALITYSDWLMLTRDEIRPEVGDKIIKIDIGWGEVSHDFFELTGESLSFITDDLESHWVEIDYNPNATKELMERNFQLEQEIGKLKLEAIKFAEWINQYQYDQDLKTNLWSHWDNPQGEHTTQELFEIFKKEQNDKRGN